MRLNHLAAATLALSLVATSMVFAHEAAKGRNGGLRVDAGPYHTELLVDGTATVAVFLSDAQDKPIAATGFKGTAILVINGKSQRFDLQPVDDLKLVGTAPGLVKVGVKGAIQLTAPDGSTAQGKF